ncbi:LON peptidase N-terminal domain and RING finger protein 3 isoform X2 [Hydra vulgaris]|uniref:LON peptidase N-terminal domain and RING finger protein 3 isoform X2 n=2 Tax=Hydra vulgaris TaxID=6087 RepID=A0ABM4D3Z1_HYDVU
MCLLFIIISKCWFVVRQPVTNCPNIQANVFFKIEKIMDQLNSAKNSCLVFQEKYILLKVKLSKVEDFGTQKWYYECLKLLANSFNNFQNEWQPEVSKKKLFKDFFLCDACEEIMYQPLVLSCGHTYCKHCLVNRQSENYIEHCFKCGNISAKRRWHSSKSSINSLKLNVCLNSILEYCFKNELQSIQLRLDGNKQFIEKNFKEAEEKYNNALSLYDSNFIALSNLSNLKASQHQYEDALSAAQKAILLSNFSWKKAFYREGIAYKGLGKMLESAISFIRYLSFGDESQPVIDVLSETVLELLQFDLVFDSVPDVVMQIKQVPLFELKGQEKFEKIVAHLLYYGITICNNRVEKTKSIEAEVIPENIIEKLKSDLNCVLCFRLLYKPSSTPCGHTFCSACLERSLDHNYYCAVCRSSIAELIRIRPKPVVLIMEKIIQTYLPQELDERIKQDQNEALVVENDIDVTTIPVFVCSYSLPTLHCPLHIFEPRYKLLLRRVIDSGTKKFGMCCYDEQMGFSEYGLMLEIKSHKMLSDGRFFIDTIGGTRFKVIERSTVDGYFTAKVNWVRDQPIPNDKLNYLKNLHKSTYEKSILFLKTVPILTIPSLFDRMCSQFGTMPDFVEEELNMEHGPKWIWWMLRATVSSELTLGAFLAMNSVEKRLEFISDLMRVIRM